PYIFSFITRQQLTVTLLPYTTLFRSDTYRMTAFYYSGDLSRGDIHLRAIIEDVVPSVASAVKTILAKLDSHVSETAKALLLDSRSEEHTSELQSRENLVCRLLLEKKN